MASQNDEAKEAVSVEHVEQLHDEKAKHIDNVEQTDKFHAMRIYGDGEDHMHEPPMSFSRAMSLIAMGFLWVGSQIPLYLFGMVSTVVHDEALFDPSLGSIPPYIYSDIGGLDRKFSFVTISLRHLLIIFNNIQAGYGS
jgi:hypothetical protein